MATEPTAIPTDKWIGRDALYYRKLAALCGHLEDSSQRVVVISQDDATRTAHVSVSIGQKTLARDYYGKTLEEAIYNAYAGEFQ